MSSVKTPLRKCLFPMCKSGFKNFNLIFNPEVMKFIPENLSEKCCEEENFKNKKVILMVEIKTKE